MTKVNSIPKPFFYSDLSFRYPYYYCIKSETCCAGKTLVNQIGYICHIYLPSFLFGLNVLTVIFWPSVGSTCHSSMLSALFMFLIRSRTSSVIFVSLDAPSTMELRLEAMPLTHKQADSINIALIPGLAKSALQKMALWLRQAVGRAYKKLKKKNSI